MTQTKLRNEQLDAAPFSASYIVLSLHPKLTNEWVLTAGSGIILSQESSSSTIFISSASIVPDFETNSSNIKTSGSEASAGSSGKVADAAHIHPIVADLSTAGVKFIYAGTGSMISGSTSLASGTIYLMYE
jgi:hypothetical protein